MQTLCDQFVKVNHIKVMVGTNGFISYKRPRVDASVEFNCKVRLLDEEQKPLIIRANREWTGRQLFEEACRDVGGLLESDYFGLRYLDRKGERQWLDLRSNIFHQLKYTVPCVVSFRVKHYPPKPLLDLGQDISRYFLYLQLRRDLQHGRLLCSPTDAQELAACVAQAELGDRCDIQDPTTSVTELRLLPNLSSQVLNKVCELYGQMKGYSPVEAESEFLEKVSRLDAYGVDPYPVKDQKGNSLYLGLTHEGVATFRGNRRSHLFKWHEITKFSYERRIFIMHVTLRDDTSLQRKKKHVLGFKCQCRRTAAAIWRWAIDRQYFFTLAKGADARRHKSGGGFLSRGNTFRFSGRCREETLCLSEGLQNKPQPQFTRSSSFRHIPQKKEVQEALTLPRAYSDQHTSFCNGSALPRNNEGVGVQFLLTSTPVKSRPTLLLHKSADELNSTDRPAPNSKLVVQDISAEENQYQKQKQAKGISEPDLFQTARSEKVDGNISAVALSGFEITSPLVQAPLTSSQVSVNSSTHHSSESLQVIEKIPKVTARKEAVHSGSMEVTSTEEVRCSMLLMNKATAPLAEIEDISEENEVVKPVPIWKAGLVVLVIFIFLILLGSILVFEGEIHSTALHGLRSSPYVEHLYTNVYRPLRQCVIG